MIYVGTDLKFVINIQCEGFNMQEHEFRIELRNGRKKLVVPKSEMVYDSDDDTWYLCFNSADLGAGDITMIVYADVEDIDFDDQTRTEVYKCTLCHIEGI